MRNKRLLLFVIVILIIGAVSTYAETKKLKQIGRYTLVNIKGEVPTAEVMKILVDKYAGDIKYGFDMAGYGDLYLPFLDQIKSATFEEKELAVGDTVMWMLFRSRGKVKIVKDLEWAGKQPVPIFSFTVQKGYKHYEIIMPRACGNISLRKIEEVIPDAVCAINVDPVKANINDPIVVDMSGSQHAKSMQVDVFGPDGAKIESKTLSPESPKWNTKFAVAGEYVFKAKAVNFEDKVSTNVCEAKTYINFPPVCKPWTSCTECKNYVGRPITIDASNSTDPDGEVVKADFEITDEAGNVVATLTDTDKPFTWEKIFDKPGTYTVTAVVTDDFGAMSEPVKTVLVVTQKKLFFHAGIGPQFVKGSHGNYLNPRVGILFKIKPDVFDFVLAGGAGLSIANSDTWKSFFQLDGVFNVHTGPAFFGAGAGFTSAVREDRDSDFDLVGNVGFKLFDNFKTAGQMLFEVRNPLGEGLSFANNHKLALIFRILF